LNQFSSFLVKWLAQIKAERITVYGEQTLSLEFFYVRTKTNSLFLWFCISMKKILEIYEIMFVHVFKMFSWKKMNCFVNSFISFFSFNVLFEIIFLN
jgi:hypothetical protein